MNMDGKVQISFLTAFKGGRSQPVVQNEHRVTFLFNGQGFDARLYYAEADLPIEAGASVEADVKFLNADLVKAFLRKGTNFDIWEGKKTAHGTML